MAEAVTEKNLSMGLINPPQGRILETSLHIVQRVAAYVFDKGLARGSLYAMLALLTRSLSRRVGCPVKLH